MTASEARDITALGPWFYDFELPGGLRTNPTLSGELRSIHADRVVMLREAVHLAFPGGLGGRATLDVGCHEGSFSHRLLEMGAESVVGVDVREPNLRRARLVADALGTKAVSWVCADAEDLAAAVGGRSRFALTLAYGLIYHCENPVRVLRQIASVTERAIVIETARDRANSLVRIVVADTGPGISPAERDKLFLPYYSTKQRGSGLALHHHGPPQV